VERRAVPEQVAALEELRELLCRQKEAVTAGDYAKLAELLQEANNWRSRLGDLSQAIAGQELAKEEAWQTFLTMLSECLRLHEDIVALAYHQRAMMEEELHLLFKARQVSQAYEPKTQVVPRCLDRRK